MPNINHDYVVSIREHVTVLSNTRQRIRHPLPLSSVSCLYYSDDKKPFLTLEKKTHALKHAFEHKKEQLKDTEHRIRQRSEEIVRDIKHQKDVTGQKLRVKKEFIIKDILETKAKVKERIEEVVEVFINSFKYNGCIFCIPGTPVMSSKALIACDKYLPLFFGILISHY